MLRKFAAGAACLVSGIVAEVLFCTVLGVILTGAWHVFAGLGRLLGL